MDSGMKIVIVEDDEILACEIRQFLEKWGYEVEVAQEFDRIAAECLSYNAHLILMDINLPYYDGFYWCSRIREVSQIPLIYISSRGDDRDKIMAIAQGGDDYVEKPFHLELLKAKIEAVLRRTYQYQIRSRAQVGTDLYYDYGMQTFVYKDVQIELTKSEKKIAAKLMGHRGIIVTREELMMELWSTDEYVSDGTLTTIISRMRSKLKAGCGSEVIVTKKGQGYLLI